MSMPRLRETFDEMMEKFEELKNTVRQERPHDFENWKAGGFLLDGTFVSNYDNLEQIVDSIDAENGDEEEGEEEEQEHHIDEMRFFSPRESHGG